MDTVASDRRKSLKSSLWALIGIGLSYFSWLNATGAVAPVTDQSIDSMRFYRGEVGIAEAQAIATSARHELSSEPMSSAALRNLALTSLIEQDPRAIARLVLAERFSRRDATTELALLEYTSSQGDLLGSIRHLDRLASVHPNTGHAILDGDIGMLTGNPKGREALARYADRPWFAKFAANSIERSTDNDDVVDIILLSNMKMADRGSNLLSDMINRLLYTGKSDAAKALAVKLGHITPAAIAEFDLSADTLRQDLAPLVWKLGDGTVVATRQLAKSGLQFDLGVNSTATLLERRTSLTSGGYRLDQSVGRLFGASSVNLAWHVDCMQGEEARKIWRQPVPLKPELITYRSTLRIPANCADQKWRLMAPAIDAQTGVSFQIASLSLQRIE